MIRPRSLRWHLVQVLLIGILPLGAFAGVLLFLLWQEQDEQRRIVQMETARLLAAAMDNALDSTVQRLGILARYLAEHPHDEREAYEAAQTALRGSPDWENVLAFRADGHGLFRTDQPFGARIPAMKLGDHSAAALAQNRPMVSPLFANGAGTPVVGVAHPVATEGKVTHVLIAKLRLHWFDELLARHALPDGGIAGIFDERMKFVARSHDGDARRGSDPAPELHRDMLRTVEGLGRYPSLDGTQVYTSWTRSRHGWWIAVALPAAPIDGALWRTIWALGGLLALVVLAGAAFAALKGRRISASLKQLEERAHALGLDRPARPAPASPVTEIDESLRALEEAAGLLGKTRAERNLLLVAEQKARGAAEAANRAKDEFLAMLGHELRNPLAAVSNAAAVLRSPRCTPQQLELASSVIARQSGHLKRLIDDLLDVGRVVSGKIRLAREPLDLQASVRNVMDTLQHAGSLAPHRVQADLSPAWIEGDATRVEQIVNNLLVNAAAHTPEGRTIRVSLARRDGHAVIEVADEGHGIALEEQERIFDAFYQGEESRRRGAGGLGIGLTLVKRLAELHGGQVRVRSDGPGRGAVFAVSIPAIDAPPAPQEAAAAASAPCTVLVVEDNEDERESLRLALELCGHRVLQAPDAPSALAALQRERPAVALIDIGLPGMDGYDLARAIRARHDAGIRLFALTGYGSPADARRALEAGFARHLTKPVEVNELAALVSHALS
jgi:signal transduction histidine kinase